MKRRITTFTSLLCKEEGLQLKLMRDNIILKEQFKLQQQSLDELTSDLLKHQKYSRKNRELGAVFDLANEQLTLQQGLVIGRKIEKLSDYVSELEVKCKQQKIKLVKMQNRIRVIKRKKKQAEKMFELSQLHIDYKAMDELVLNRISRGKKNNDC